MSHPDRVKEFVKVIGAFGYQYNVYDVFRDWAEVAAATLHQMPYHAGFAPKDEAFERVEASYMETVKKYSREELDRFAHLISITLTALQEQHRDFLGDCFMRLELANEWVGQFFTPYEVSYLIARVNLENLPDVIAAHGLARVLEPACGAGGMVVAVAQVAEEMQQNPSTDLYVEAWDVDRKCANMTYIQTAALGLTGLVVHGNTLTQEVIEARFTPAARINPMRFKRMLEAAGEQNGDGASQIEQATPEGQLPMFDLEAV